MEVTADPTPVALFARFRPAVHVSRAGHHEMNRLAETALVRSWGGHGVPLPLVDGFATRSPVERFRDGTEMTS